jgi:hypothetical protein
MSVRRLRTLIEEKANIPADRQQLLVGYPPAAAGDDYCCKDGETIIVTDRGGGDSISVSDVGREASTSQAASAVHAPGPALDARAPLVHTPGPALNAWAPGAPAQGSVDAVAISHKIPADNNCLFAALIFVMHLDGTTPQELREAVKRCVLADPVSFPEAILGMEPAKYADWITAKDHWGGEIEMTILSKHLRKQIAAFDIISQRVFVYGEADGFDELVGVLYDGIHFDSVVVIPCKDVPIEFGTTIFQPAEHETFLALGRRLAQDAHAARAFTDTAKFTLRCLDCQTGLVGERGAQEHAKSTGHINFSEY